MKLIPLALFFLLLITPSAMGANYRVGVSPLVLDLGKVERGSSVVATFYLSSAYDGDLIVRTNVEQGNIDFFNKDQYKDFVFNYSEENATSWIEFINNPITIENKEENNWKAVNFLLNIPEDAESGYHNVLLSPVPYVSQGFGKGVSIVGVVAVNLLFNIEGKSERKLNILDITKTESGNSVVIDTVVQNTGTVTIHASGLELKIMDESGNEIKKTQPSSDFVKPGEVKPLKSYIDPAGLEPGDYVVFSKIKYGTGFVEKTTNLRIDNIPETGRAISQTKQWNFPWLWIIVIIILVIGFLIYRHA